MLFEKFWEPAFWLSLWENALFICELALVIIVMLLLAYIAEKVIKKRLGDTEKILTTRKIAVIGVFAAMAGILMAVEVPIFGIPDFYKFEVGDLPGLICGFAYGPVAGVMVEMCKILVKLLFRSTGTAFVGELANFLIGCSLVLPATCIYWIKKSKKSAIIGCITGAVCMMGVGSLLNGFYLLPTFVKLFFDGDLQTLINICQAVNPKITNITGVVIFASLPMNVLKSVAVSLIAILLYKPLSPVLKTLGTGKKKAASEKKIDAAE